MTTGFYRVLFPDFDVRVVPHLDFDPPSPILTASGHLKSTDVQESGSD
jgi:hypothetical protein